MLRKRNTERTINLEDFFIDYGKQDLAAGEFVEKVIVPKPNANQKYRTYKLSKRFDQDISAVCGAFRVTLDGNTVTDARFAYGGMAATPKRAVHAEAAVVGQEWSEAVAQTAMTELAKDFTPLTDMRASADYRMLSAQNLLMKLYAETTEGEAIRLVGEREAAYV